MRYSRGNYGDKLDGGSAGSAEGHCRQGYASQKDVIQEDVIDPRVRGPRPESSLELSRKVARIRDLALRKSRGMRSTS